MSHYPPPDQSGYPHSDQPYNPAGGYQQPYGGAPGGYPQGPEGYPPPQQPYGQEYNPSGGYQQPYGGGLPGGFPDAQHVPVEHLPPGYNPATRSPYQPHELPYGASPAPEGYEGYIPEGMSRDEAQSRGFLGATGGGLLGAWLGHKFGKTHGNHGFLGTIGGAGLGGWLGNKIF